ncbi:hypothetical protein FQR65_LT17502 [Abscondita terminalis]|nr:hypothetical protein FQR65_LT17502 [Abscondita terminalis]
MCDAESEFVEGQPLKLLPNIEINFDEVLAPGDLLYVPPGLAHYGVAEDECLTYSFGFRMPNIADMMDRVSDKFVEDQRLRNPLLDVLRHKSNPIGQVTQAELDYLKTELLAQLNQSDVLEDAIMSLMAEPKYPENIPDAEAIGTGDLEEVLEQGYLLQIEPASRLIYLEQNNELLFWANDGHAVALNPQLSEQEILEDIAGLLNESILCASLLCSHVLSANAILALNTGAKKGNFYHDTGEGSLSPYHLKPGGDIVWEIASGYFGCRTLDGKFDPEKFKQQAALPQIKMIEIKLSQGAKPGHGGILPKDKITKEIAEIRGVSMDVDCVFTKRPFKHLVTTVEMMYFIQQLRELSNGKPVGFKLCIGQPWQFMSIVKAMLQTKIVPDFIVVDGSEGGTGAAPIELIDHMGTPLREGLLFVHNTLVGAGLRSQVKIGASGKIISAFDIASTMAMGADWVNSARGFMFAVGCIQAQSCHTNQCPVGVATQNKERQKALDVPSKADRVFNFQKNTLKALAEMIAAAGLQHPAEIKAHHLAQRINDREIKNYAQLHFWMKDGELLCCEDKDEENFYFRMWNLASAERF